ncbi:envelope integrity protein Cei [Actinokineospora sp. PR83]|uniref:envelope integrity protein Cei n=1 Tax=Actinokineospora sp. PR83 TaxID=2884908 RepID=UPI0027DFFC3F|nr:envelope integrity protein Cei [Actinokineospora sp. PR83]MCG8918079.1 envelope integrity protein Cei [Actinokineospora sp. PR83]
MAAAELSAAGVQAPYRKRRPLPALIFLAVLCLVATVVWFQVLGSDSEADAANACAPPPTPVPAADGRPAPALGQPLPDDALDRTTPAAPGGSLLRVVNASGQRRQAGAVTEALRELGFTQVTDPANDTVYTNGSLTCRAQIRFGQQGMPAARTLSLIEPCAELVRDERQDATVDLAIGQRYTHLEPTTASRRILEQLSDWAQNGPQGGLQNAEGTGPALDPALLAAIEKTRC